MLETFNSFLSESSIAPQITNHYILQSYIRRREFRRCIHLIQTIKFSPNLISSVDDLFYILAKYEVIYLSETKQFQAANQCITQLLYPLVQKEIKNGGVRAQWFASDFELIQNLTGSNVQPNNPYQNFDWETDMIKFWRGIDDVRSKNLSKNIPLFAYSLEALFGGPSGALPSLKDTFADADRFKKVQLLCEPDLLTAGLPVKKYKYKSNSIESEFSDLVIGNPIALPIIKASSISTRHTIARSVASDTRTNAPQSFRENYNMPAKGPELENSSFTLAHVSGPSSGPIKVMAVHCLKDTGRIIAAVAGGDDRLDKKIYVWDIKTDVLVAQLNNSTSKPIISLIFHPSYPELLLSSDMSNDVKLWNWKEGTLIRWWKKHHSRIIFQLGFVPGDDTRYP